MTAGTTYGCGNGYKCAAGSESITGNELCPIDAWCAGGVETACVAGTYSTIGGIEAATECVECAPGKICASLSVGIIDCPAGSYCPGNHSSTGDISACTAGHYCPTGSKIELDCTPGTF